MYVDGDLNLSGHSVRNQAERRNQDSLTLRTMTEKGPDTKPL